MFDRFKRTRLGVFTAPMRVNAGTPQPRRRGLFASDMFGVLGDRRHRTALLAGFLSQQNHFGSLECWIGGASPALRMWANGDGARLDPGKKMTTDWACLQFLHLDSPEPLGTFLEAVARGHNISPELVNQHVPVGWCSWYQFFQNISPEKIRANLQRATSLGPALPLNLIQIDDGFESQVGDWFTFTPDFADGVAPLAEEIHTAGFTPGLWLAPFIVHPKSRLAADHPDWLLRGRLGRPANAGYLWDAFTTALDLTHPEALAYACEVVRTAVQEWGFRYLKLDFLYAAALPGRRYDPTRTRAQVLRAALQALREAAGKGATLVGCGCPLGSAIGLVDGMRIGADVEARWEPVYKGVQAYFRQEPDMPSARNAAHNALTRASLHRRWWSNDPDCLLLRPGTQLSLPEIQTLATVIALTGGAVMLSDHLPDLPPERLRIAQSLLPVIGKRPHLLDWFDQPTPTRLQLDLSGATGAWHLLALFNWGEHKQNIDLNLSDTYLDPQGEYYARDFWNGKTGRIANGRLTLVDVPAHGVALLAVRPYRPHLAQYLGSDLHISQGLEVTAWDSAPGRLILRLERPGPDQGQIELSLPHPPTEAWWNGKEIEWQECGERRYLFSIAMEQTATLEVKYKA